MPPPTASGEAGKRGRLERLALLLIAAGGAVRLFASFGRSLSPDEALHLELAAAPDLAGAYRASLSNAHPPLFFLLLHGWEGVARSEWSLRLLPVVCGTAFLWLAWRWAKSLLDGASGLIALSLLAFLPSLALLSAELRAYSLLLLFVAGALAALERAFETGSARWVWASGASMCLAILTHYSAIWVALAAFVYAARRLSVLRPRARLIVAWAACQAAQAALFLLLFLTHVARLRGGSLEHQAQEETLRSGYFQAAAQGPIAFVLRETASVFQFFFGSTAAGIVAVALAALGVISLGARRRPAALLLGLPFLFGAGAGILRLYPYVGTRHAAYLAPFAAAAIAAAIRPATGQRAWPALVVGAALLPFGFVAARDAAQERPRERMAAVAEAIVATVPPGSVVFSDAGTASVIGHYLGGHSGQRAGGYTIVAAPVWTFDPALFGAELRRMVDSGALPSGHPFWVLQADWGFRAAEQVRRAYPQARLGASRQFGEIELVEVEIRARPRP